MINITLPDNSIKTFEKPITGMDIAKSISEGFAATCVAMELNGAMCDLKAAIKQDARVTLITTRDKKALEILRHSTAHVMAHAIENLYKGAKLTIGPTVEDGFYYDIDMAPVSEDDFQAIEAEMKRLIKAKLPIEREEVSKDRALEIYKENAYKIELISELENESISIYTQGDFSDLCRGPHIPHTGLIKAFKR